MKGNICLALLLGGALWACQPEEARGGTQRSGVDLNREMPGTWEIVNIRVDIHSPEGQDTIIQFEIPENEWEPVYNVKPKRTYFEVDKRYREEFRSIRDSLISSNSGEWSVEGDSLFMTEADTSYHYKVSVARGFADFRSLIDWDGDGEKDDDYFARHRRVSRGTQ